MANQVHASCKPSINRVEMPLVNFLNSVKTIPKPEQTKYSYLEAREAIHYNRKNKDGKRKLKRAM